MLIFTYNLVRTHSELHHRLWDLDERGIIRMRSISSILGLLMTSRCFSVVRDWLLLLLCYLSQLSLAQLKHESHLRGRRPLKVGLLTSSQAVAGREDERGLFNNMRTWLCLIYSIRKNIYLFILYRKQSLFFLLNAMYCSNNISSALLYYKPFLYAVYYC